MNFDDPYQAYLEGSVVSLSPMALVVKLYEGAIGALQEAQTCLDAKNVMGRGKAVNRVIAILMELLSSLDHERGGEISRNLSGLYCYVQGKVLEGHLQQKKGPFREAEDLMRNLLEGWHQAEQKLTSQGSHAGSDGYDARHLSEASGYGYPPEMHQGVPTVSASF